MKERYEKLFELIGRANDTKAFDLEEVLKEAVVLFDSLRKEYPKASKEEKQELIEMMNRLYKHLQEMSKKVGEKTGLSEEEISNYSENPNNFSPEQWRTIQESKEKLTGSVQRFGATLRETAPKAAPKKAVPRAKGIKNREWA